MKNNYAFINRSLLALALTFIFILSAANLRMLLDQRAYLNSYKKWMYDFRDEVLTTIENNACKIRIQEVPFNNAFEL